MQQLIRLWEWLPPHEKKKASFYRKKLESLFVNPHFVFLFRKDVVSQVISMHIANQTQAWSSERSELMETTYDYKQIKRVFFETVRQIKMCQSIAKVTAYPKITITYEEMEEDYFGTLDRIAQLLNTNIEVTEAINKKTVSIQRTERNVEWKKRFLIDFKKEYPNSKLPGLSE